MFTQCWPSSALLLTHPLVITLYNCEVILMRLKGRKCNTISIMSTKTLIYIGITVGGLLGGFLGSLLDHGNPFGAWGIILSTVGGLAGIWAGYKVGTSI